ncbi:MAG: hypothetical protein HOF21_09710 [Nitrospina sp.]|nr:hypothetical protein [Nitrospina sp.]MBT5631352.1 hypothetical protein [Nitrospina sp.]
MAANTPKFDLSKISIREIIIVVGTFLFAVGYGFYEFEYIPQMKKFADLEKQSKEVQASIGAFQKILINPSKIKKTTAQIKKIKNEIEEMQAAIEKTKSRLKGQGIEILSNLQGEADFYGVFLKSMKTSEKNLSRAGLRLKEVSLVMEIESDYNALKSFVASLKDFPAVITVESLETTRNEKILPKLESRLHIKVIVL